MAIDPITASLLLGGASKAIKTGSRLLQPKFGNLHMADSLNKLEEMEHYLKVKKQELLVM